MSQSSSESYGGNVIYGTNEATRPITWPLIVALAVAGLLALVWFNRK